MTTLEIPSQASNGIVYLASPYSHPNPIVQRQRFHDVCLAAAALMRKGHIIYSPIAHCHPIATFGRLDTDAVSWRRHNFAFLAVASEFWVLELDGWEDSEGIAAEIQEADRLRKMIRYVKPAVYQ